MTVDGQLFRGNQSSSFFIILFIFRRVDASLEFYNNTWNDYKVGFNNGIESGNLWLGNDRIHVMSTQSNVILRVEIYGNRYPNNTNSNIYLYSTYNFSVNTMLIKTSVLKNFIKRLKLKVTISIDSCFGCHK
jgi:hypothetical protein